MIVPAIGGSYWATFFPGVVALGLGMAVSVAPLTTTVMNAVAKDQAGIASGVSNAVSRLAGLLAIAVFGIILVHVFSARLDRKLLTLEVPPKVKLAIDAQKTRLAAIEIPPHMHERLIVPARRAMTDAYVTGFRSIMAVSATLSLFSALCAWLLIE